jgi:hypothetical protein
MYLVSISFVVHVETNVVRVHVCGCPLKAFVSPCKACVTLDIREGIFATRTHSTHHVRCATLGSGDTDLCERRVICLRQSEVSAMTVKQARALHVTHM